MGYGFCLPRSQSLPSGPMKASPKDSPSIATPIESTEGMATITAASDKHPELIHSHPVGSLIRGLLFCLSFSHFFSNYLFFHYFFYPLHTRLTDLHH